MVLSIKSAGPVAASTPVVLAPPIPQWVPYAAGDGGPACHATRLILKKALAGLVFLAVSVTLGCATSGNPAILDHTRIEQLSIGVTKKEEVRKLFGEPNFVSQSATTEIWSYGHASIETSPVTFVPIVGLFAGSSSVESNSLGLSFDKDGILRHINKGHTNAVGGPGAH